MYACPQLDADRSGAIDAHEYITFALKEALARSSTRVIDLFREWDVDMSGTIDREEFRRAIRALGFELIVEDAEIDRVFAEMDGDGNGTVDYHELHKFLRRRAPLRECLQMGAGGEIQTKAVVQHRLRKRGDGEAPGRRSAICDIRSRGGLDASGADTLSLQRQLRTILSDNAVRVIDLFREWDENGDVRHFRPPPRPPRATFNRSSSLHRRSPHTPPPPPWLPPAPSQGLISRGEFQRAMYALGVEECYAGQPATFDDVPWPSI